MDIAIAWQNLEMATRDLEAGAGEIDMLTATAQAAIVLLLEHEPARIVEQAMASPLPGKALVRWIVFEGQRIGGLDRARLSGLVDYWNAHMAAQHGELLARPVMAA